jgi:hypothetical protein
MLTPLPDWFDHVDVADWAVLPPEELLRKRGENPDRYAAARAFKYSRAGATLRYDEIGFRWTAAAPLRGAVPLQTIDSARLKQTEAERLSGEAYDVFTEEQARLRHRPLDLPLDLPADTAISWQLRGKLIDFIVKQDSGTVQKEEVWTFSLSAPPRGMMALAHDSDSALILTQHENANVPGATWVPFLELLEAGHFWRMQHRRDRLVSATTPGRFYCFVSHRWLAVAEPDPEGRQAAVLAWQMFAHLCDAVRVAKIRGLHTPRKFIRRTSAPVGPAGSSLAEALLVNVLRPAADERLIEQAWQEVLKEEHLTATYGVPTAHQDIGLTTLSEVVRRSPVLRSLLDRIFLWYDYSCLPQAPRSSEDELLFRTCLPHLPTIQLLGRTAILLDDAVDYLSRAWCSLEALVADPRDTIDLLVGSNRGTARAGAPALHFEHLILDRPHIQWRAILDTEVFKLQTPEQCMARLNLSATEPADVLFIYERLRRLAAPRKVHSDDMEVVTGVIPLPVLDERRVLIPLKGWKLELAWKTGQQRTLNWTGALEVAAGWGPNDSAPSVPPFMQFSRNVLGRDGRPSCHIVVIAACEGEAVLVSSWVRGKRGELEELLGIAVQSLSWLSTDIAPVGHFVQGTLRATAVDCHQWLVISSQARFTNCNVTALIMALIYRAKRRGFALVIDERENNLLELEPSDTQPAADRFEEIDLSMAVFPTHLGGLFRSTLEYLVTAPPGEGGPHWPDTLVGD